MTPHTQAHWTLWGLMYRAHDDEIGADASPCGRGRTEAEAVADLQRQMEDRDDAEAAANEVTGSRPET